MPSAERRRFSLASRVAFGTAFAAAIASLVAAIVTLLVTDRLMLDQEDRRLRGAGTIALHELPVVDAKIPPAIEDEEEELAPESIRIAYRRDGVLLGGDESLPDVANGVCDSRAALQATVRVCAVSNAHYRVVVATTRASRSPYWIVLPCAVAVAIAAAFAALAGRRSAQWALAPLFRLRDSLDTISDDDPRAAKLAGDEACSEVATLRATIEALLGRLAGALEGARSFSGDAAHELKTPLTALRAELDLLAEENLDPVAAAAVERLRARVIVLARLVERLLALARASVAGRLDLEAVALEDVIQDVLARLPATARARVHVEADVPGMVNGDELLLAALLENAVENALKFSGEAGVEVTLNEADGAVIVEVTDHGPGLPAEERKRAFEPFFRSPSSRANTTGHGVGLAIVAQVAHAHRGTAAFVDPPERGARLRVTVPAWSSAGG